MRPRAEWLFLALSSVLLRGPCGASITYRCPTICSCSAHTFQCNRDTQLSSRATSDPRILLTVIGLTLKLVPTHAFRDLLNISSIAILQSRSISGIQRQAFFSLHTVTRITVSNMISLQYIEEGAFTDLPELEYLSISNTGLLHFPAFTTISSLASRPVLDMADNIRIHAIPANSFQGISKEPVVLNLRKNGFQEIQAHAFNGTNLDSVDVSCTALSALPERGLENMTHLIANSTYALKTLPDLGGLSKVRTAELTYPSHCCAFDKWRNENKENNALADSHVNYLFQQECLNSSDIDCTPKTDDFNPCEDLLGFSILRCLSWIITIFAITGNLAVLLILLISHNKLTISRFLMCNLAFADLCMGLYLMLIAFMDIHSLHEYYNHATYWQTGPGCGIAGFLTVFASELSVYTLTVISLERWHTITNAMHVNKRLKMHHVAAMMVAGWFFSLLVALLPLVGISSYGKVSICLPMDIDTPISQIYVIVILIVNVIAFIVVCYCYICIYFSVHKPQHSTRNGDTKIAKRMAVLIFTDFICMAPISFFAISAALKMPLITVSHSKILLILFYPVNSLCNPFLYTIFTRGFRKDVCALLGRCGCCPGQADFYRSQTMPSHLSNAQKTASGKSHSLSFYAHRLKMKGCLLNRGAT
uniref:G-protein coupled receptors family 1 profile domain-containing protein n=1 Tax=Knipowitschia caucasica TaxID=637954 RepID=A0AAV2JSB0_KNICA